MLCKHFNLSFVDIRDDVSLADYILMLAEAAEAEASDQYEYGVMSYIAFHNPKKLKSIKQQVDRLRRVDASQNIANSILNFAAKFTGGKFEPNGSAEEYAKATGRKVAYLSSDGRLFDKDGNPVVRDELTTVVRMETIH